ncbi:aromatic ring-hydroxylating dioxygenase subunit alpha [Phormidium sp. CLA17]|uniref:aromatic ring-hydroxylating oxygenase subunit alpha n=1 Tax=Leptolyngbya sp. Cla-17 TaxID=2803751 RepID=UPI001491F08F|nr:aromatic ring-hydroxylating dioxygenase subunit alpha [Leptolyngbya sp. Cla-17]MBM0744473.1 aromatic ring-hydroxylating dioxygenase subunit alpha [Leptolyngbya sp. Cla-17]
MLVPTTKLADRVRLTELQEKIQYIAARPLECATALPAQAYTAPDFYQWEVEHIFKKQWLCVGHISQVPKPGDYINLDLLDEPISIVHGKDDQIRVLSRVCAHRGMDIMPEGFGHPAQGNRRSFLCPYHHWSYGLDGHLFGAPEMHQSQQFERDKICLPTFRSEIWQGFVFVTFDATLESVSTHYAQLLPYVERWNMGSMEMVANLQWDCRFNWKVLVENFMEPYHHLGTHCKTFEPMMPAAGTWTEPALVNTIVCHLPLAKSIVDQVKAGNSPSVFQSPSNLLPDDHYEYSVCLGTPNFLLFIGPDRVYWYLLLPTSAGEMTLHTTLLVTPESKEMPGFEQVLEQEIAALRKFHLEDVEVCTAVQRGLRSSLYSPGPLGHLEMPIWLFQQYLAQQIQADSNQ